MSSNIYILSTQSCPVQYNDLRNGHGNAKATSGACRAFSSGPVQQTIFSKWSDMGTGQHVLPTTTYQLVSAFAEFPGYVRATTTPQWRVGQ
jgi:hypothetical protein